MYTEQLDRIRRKLKEAASVDAECNVFGAKKHRYELNAPLDREALNEFQSQHGITLPEPYATFLTEIGNGGAGPYYGIHPLGTRQSIDLDRIGEPTTFQPDKPKGSESLESSESLEGSGGSEDSADSGDQEAINSTDEVGEKATEGDMDEVSEDEDCHYPGLLNIGEQGCSYETMLIVTGEHRGKMMYIDLDSNQTFFTYEGNFLDWYERWLDETIAGYDDSWFGMNRPGDDRELIALYRSTEDEDIRLQALQGMHKLKSITDETALFLQGEYRGNSGELRSCALRILAKMAFGRAEPLIREQLHERDSAMRLSALQTIHWYMPKKSTVFKHELVSMLSNESDPEAFRFLTYILVDAEIDILEAMLPYFKHSDREFRKTALYTAGKAPAKNKTRELQAFIDAVQEESDAMVRISALQALRDIHNSRLYPVFEHLLREHKTNKDYVRSNIESLLRDFPFHSAKQIERLVPHELELVRGMLRRLLPDDSLTDNPVTVKQSWIQRTMPSFRRKE